MANESNQLGIIEFETDGNWTVVDLGSLLTNVSTIYNFFFLKNHDIPRFNLLLKTVNYDSQRYGNDFFVTMNTLRDLRRIERELPDISRLSIDKISMESPGRIRIRGDQSAAIETSEAIAQASIEKERIMTKDVEKFIGARIPQDPPGVGVQLGRVISLAVSGIKTLESERKLVNVRKSLERSRKGGTNHS